MVTKLVSAWLDCVVVKKFVFEWPTQFIVVTQFVSAWLGSGLGKEKKKQKIGCSYTRRDFVAPGKKLII
jgi:hypothetical protein